ncbi:MAG: ribonuclease Z [Bacteroidales bacterium]|nr:ribonuclease Z [Bacteroidales bacterium]
MEFSLTTLGTSSASPNPLRHTSCHVVTAREHHFLIDCGEGCQMQLQRASIPFSWIDNIFISHLHGDHLFGIFGLLSTMSMQGRTAPLYIYAPEGFAAILDFFMKQFADGVLFEIVFTPLGMKGKEVILDLRTVEVSAFPLNHRVPTFGFLFREKEPQRNVHKWRVEADDLTLAEIGALKNGQDVMRENGDVLEVGKYTYIPWQPRSLAYCCDTAPFDGLAGWIEGVDLLYHDATYADDKAEMAVKYYHSTGRMAAETALAARAGRLVLGHFSARYRNLDQLLEEARSVFPDTAVANDGQKYEIPLVKLSR